MSTDTQTDNRARFVEVMTELRSLVGHSESDGDTARIETLAVPDGRDLGLRHLDDRQVLRDHARGHLLAQRTAAGHLLALGRGQALRLRELLVVGGAVILGLPEPFKMPARYQLALERAREYMTMLNASTKAVRS